MIQYINYLKGLQLEIEMGDFYGAKQYYIAALTKTVYVNHRIRKQTLERLIRINQRIGFPKDSPEKVLISRYFIKQKYVQVLLDISSFPNTKTLKATMNLPKMLFNNLGMEDFFGLKVLKQSINPNAPYAGYLEDVVVLEAKALNAQVKAKYLDDFTQDLQAHHR